MQKKPLHHKLAALGRDLLIENGYFGAPSHPGCTATVDDILRIRDLVNAQGRALCMVEYDAYYSYGIDTNGCGPLGWAAWKVSMLSSPFWLLRLVSLKPEGRAHDTVYSIGGDERDRLRGDNFFFDAIVAKCKKRLRFVWNVGLKVGVITAIAYRKAVRDGGDEHFNLWSRSYGSHIVKPVAS